MASIQGIYLALFGRPADPSGLLHWNGVTNNGADLSQISDLAEVPEYLNKFSGFTNEQIINSIYQNLFARDADAEGLAFFLGELTSGRQNINTIAINILDGAQGSDLELVNNKIDAANLFTQALDTDVEENAYVGSSAAEIGAEYIAEVTVDTPATKADADAAVLKLFTDSGNSPIEAGGGSTTVTPPVNTAPVFELTGDGKVTTDIASSSWDAGTSVTVAEDGKILVAGLTFNGEDSDFALVRYNANGTLDATFDKDGIVTTDIDSSLDAGLSVTVDNAGRVLVAGGTLNNTGSDFALVRYNTDGTLDTTFNTTGIVTTDVGIIDAGLNVSVDANNKILVTGISYTEIDPDYNGVDGNFSLVQYNDDGTLDADFGDSGIVTTNIGSRSEFGLGATVDGEGNILVAGFNPGYGALTLVRYDSTGKLDKSFNETGVVTPDIDGFNVALDVIVDSDDNIVVTGLGFTEGGKAHIILARVDSDGDLDDDFGNSGIIRTDISPFDAALNVTIDADNNILVTGISYNETEDDTDFVLVRYTPDGILDTSFNGTGIVTTDIAGYDAGLSVTIDANGSILVAGVSFDQKDSDFSLVRYNDNGSLDTTFDPDQGGLGDTVVTGGAPVIIDSDVTFYDAELDAAGDYGGATLTLVRDDGTIEIGQFSGSGDLGTLINGEAVPGGQTVSELNKGKLIEGGELYLGTVDVGYVATNSDGELKLIFDAGVTQDQVNDVAQALQYQILSLSIDSLSTEIEWTFSDGNSGAQGTGGEMSIVGISTIEFID